MRQRVFALLISLTVVLFAFKNTQNVSAFFTSNALQLSLAVIVLAAFVGGALAGILFFQHKRSSAELMVKQLRRKIVFLKTPDPNKK